MVRHYELIKNFIKSDNMISIDNLFANVDYDDNNVFRYRWNNGLLLYIKVKDYQNKKKNFLEIYLFWYK